MWWVPAKSLASISFTIPENRESLFRMLPDLPPSQMPPSRPTGRKWDYGSSCPNVKIIFQDHNGEFLGGNV